MKQIAGIKQEGKRECINQMKKMMVLAQQISRRSQTFFALFYEQLYKQTSSIGSKFTASTTAQIQRVTANEVADALGKM